MNDVPRIPLLGYSDRLSARAGETIEFKVSSSSPNPFEAHLVRLISSDPNPAGPGIIEEQVEATFTNSYPSRIQPFQAGSYAQIDVRGTFSKGASFTVMATIWPTLPGDGEQAILSQWHGDATAGSGFCLMLDDEGRPTFEVGVNGGPALRICCDEPLHVREWGLIWASIDVEAGIISVGHIPNNSVRKRQIKSHDLNADCLLAETANVIISAKGGDLKTAFYNGKIERPAIYQTIFDDAIAAEAQRTSNGLLARWDFSRATKTTRIEDVGPNGLDGELFNLPARAMTGSLWTGQEMCWRHAPDHYAAIHFHEDDIYDFGWDTDFSFDIPQDLPSGIYGARITCDDYEDTMPFFVCPPKGKQTARLCVLVSTYTYSIYGNHSRPDFEDSWKERFEAWNAYPWNPAEYPEYGLSTYNFHKDGSGICHASHRRPLFTIRPGYVTYGYGESSGLRHFQADSHLIAWLEARGIAYDLITDQELNDEGAGAIAGYTAVTTGSHPEYHTENTLDALQTYRDTGGKFLYLGGNGFYWRIAEHQSATGVLEIRRAEAGIRAWAAEPGEYFNAFDGTYGGLWRRNGRPPQKLAGVGFSSQGQFEGSCYRVKSPPPDCASWLLKGIEDELLGDFGLSGGGAAGFELDRADVHLGSPDNIQIVASSENHSDAFILVPEERLTHLVTLPGEPEADLIRADMVYFDVPGGGAVFATGSITFCGSLPHNNYDNNISQLLMNVLNHFGVTT